MYIPCWVRSNRFSRFNPQFNRNVLKRHLKKHGIRYVFLGRELGARSIDPSCYKDGRVQYKRLATTALFQEGIDRVLRGLKDFRVALMCAEKEPLDCHRTILVSDVLSKRGVTVNHILATGEIEPHEQTMTRLLDLFGLPHQDLFRSHAELLEEARALQETRIAYVNQDSANQLGRGAT